VVPTLRREWLPFFGVDVVLADGDLLVERELGFGHDQGRHQLGQRSDREHRLRVLAEQHLVGVLVEDQGDAGLELQRVGCGMQARQLAERRTRGCHVDDRDVRPSWPRGGPRRRATFSWRRDGSVCGMGGQAQRAGDRQQGCGSNS
jgi:hypothetical protein